MAICWQWGLWLPERSLFLIYMDWRTVTLCDPSRTHWASSGRPGRRQHVRGCWCETGWSWCGLVGGWAEGVAFHKKRTWLVTFCTLMMPWETQGGLCFLIAYAKMVWGFHLSAQRHSTCQQTSPTFQNNQGSRIAAFERKKKQPSL